MFLHAQSFLQSCRSTVYRVLADDSHRRKEKHPSCILSATKHVSVQNQDACAPFMWKVVVSPLVSEGKVQPPYVWQISPPGKLRGDACSRTCVDTILAFYGFM
jgi:hypothetical protein